MPVKPEPMSPAVPEPSVLPVRIAVIVEDDVVSSSSGSSSSLSKS